MAGLGKLFGLGEKAKEAAEKLAKSGHRVEPEIGQLDEVVDTAKTAKPKLSKEEAEAFLKKQEAKGAETHNTTSNLSAKNAEELLAARKEAMKESLSVLNPGRIPVNPHNPAQATDILNQRLNELQTSAKENGLIDASLKSTRNPLKTEEALLNGRPVSPSELKGLEDQKVKDFSRYGIELEADKAKAITKANKTVFGKIKDTVLGIGAMTALPIAIYGAYDSVDTWLINPKNPGAFGKFVPSAINKYFGNDKSGDDYAEFLLNRYETGVLDPVADLKEYYEINFNDISNIKNLPKSEQYNKNIEILTKLTNGPINPMPPKTSADLKNALNQYVTKNLNIGPIAGTENEINDLLALYSTKQLNKNSQSALTAPPVNIGNAIGGGSRQAIEIVVEEEQTPVQLDEKTLNTRLNQMVEDFYIKPDEKAKLQEAWKTASTKPNASEVFLQNSTEILSDPSVGRAPDQVELVQRKIGGVDNTR